MKNVLVTGGSGFFGRHITRRLLEGGAERVCVFSRGEYAQALMRDQFANDSRLRWFIGDVRDAARLRRAMEGCDVVIHAAALKRIEVCEYCPDEARKTNVDGAQNVIDGAIAAGVRKVVALSTDKACNPVNAYGASKLMAERLILAANNMRGADGPIFATTRYGNVWNSTGSVVPVWRAALAGGAPSVRVTDPDVTRFFMTIDQAADLVLDTLKTMRGGELAIPDLPAYRLGDLADAMEVKTEVVGLGCFEKLHETMNGVTTSEQARRMTVNELKLWLEVA